MTARATVTMYSTPWCGYCHRLQEPAGPRGHRLRGRRHRAACPTPRSSSSRSTAATRPCRPWCTPTASAQTNPSVAQVKAKLAALGLSVRPALTSDPGSGPPYHASTSDRQIEMPPGSTSVPGLGLAPASPRG